MGVRSRARSGSAFRFVSSCGFVLTTDMTFTAGVGRLLVTSAAVSREVVEEDFGDKRKNTDHGQCIGLCCGWGAALTPSSLLLSSATALSVVVVVVLLLTLPRLEFFLPCFVASHLASSCAVWVVS